MHNTHFFWIDVQCRHLESNCPDNSWTYIAWSNQTDSITERYFGAVCPSLEANRAASDCLSEAAATSTVAMLGMMGRRYAYALALATANVKSVICGLAETYTMMEVYSWQKTSEMQLSISNGVIMPLTYTVIPLTTNLGLNESQVSRGVSYKISTSLHVLELTSVLTWSTENQH